jgi:hypothetical protein
MKKKYIMKCISLSRWGILRNGTWSKVSELERLRYKITRATIIENLLFFSIFQKFMQI